MLGDIIATLDAPGAAESVLLEANDLALVAEVLDAANRLELTMGDFVSLAVRRFVDRADDEDWLALVNVMDRSEAPGTDALSAILRRAVADAREAVA